MELSSKAIHAAKLQKGSAAVAEAAEPNLFMKCRDGYKIKARILSKMPLDNKEQVFYY